MSVFSCPNTEEALSGKAMAHKIKAPTKIFAEIVTSLLKPR